MKRASGFYATPAGRVSREAEQTSQNMTRQKKTQKKKAKKQGRGPDKKPRKPRVYNDQYLTNQISLLCSSEEKEFLKSKSTLLCTNISGFLRALIHREMRRSFSWGKDHADVMEKLKRYKEASIDLFGDDGELIID